MRMCGLESNVARAAFAGALGLAAAGSAQALTVDFEGLSNGDNVEGMTFAAGTAAEFVATSSGDHDGIHAFDTTVGGPNAGGGDPDLLVNSGIALILQDSDTSEVPNDANEGGMINFAFAAAVELISMDVIDFDAGTGGSSIMLTDTDGDTRTFTFTNNFTGEGGDANPADGIATIDFSDTSTRSGPGGGMVSVADVGTFDLTSVSALKTTFSGSGAIDTLVAVPLPAPVGLAGAGLLGLAARRRREM